MIPYGWAQTDPESKILQPVARELELLEQAIKYLASKQYTTRDLATWIAGETGRTLSHQGLLVAVKYFKSQRVKERAIAQATAESSTDTEEQG